MTTVGVSIILIFWVLVILLSLKLFFLKNNSRQEFPNEFESILLVITFILLEIAIQLTIPAIFLNISIENGFFGLFMYLLKWFGFLIPCLYRVKGDSRTFTFKKVNLKWIWLGILVGLIATYPILSLDRFIADNFNLPVLQTNNYSFEIKLIKGILLTPIFEEILFREIILSSFLIRLKTINAIFFSSGLFTLIHSNLNFALGTFCFGIILGLLYSKTKSVYATIVAHSIFNLLSFLFY